MVMIPRYVSKNDRADTKTFRGITKEHNLDSGVGVGKDRATYTPSIAPTNAPNDNKKTPSKGVISNRFFVKIEINAE